MSQIITPENRAADKQEAAQVDPAAPAAQLNQYEAERIAGALARLHELEDTKVITPTSDAEKAGLRAFVSNSFIKHAPAFLGAYFTLKGEYEPLIGTVSLFLRRVQATVNHMNAQEHAQRLAAAKAQAAANPAPTPSPEAAALKAKDAAQAEAKINAAQ